MLVEPPVDYAVLERKVVEAVKDHVTFEIGRPELMNRIGNNIAVFSLSMLLQQP